MTPKNRPTSVYLPLDLIAEIDAAAARSAPPTGHKFSRNLWIVAAIRAALDASKTTPAPAPAQNQNT